MECSKKIAVGTSSINLLLTFLAATTLVKARLIPFSIRVFVFCLFICDSFILICCVMWAVSEVLGQLALRVERMFIILEWLLTGKSFARQDSCARLSKDIFEICR